LGGSTFIMYSVEYQCCIFMCFILATTFATTSLIIHCFSLLFCRR